MQRAIVPSQQSTWFIIIIIGKGLPERSGPGPCSAATDPAIEESNKHLIAWVLFGKIPLGWVYHGLHGLELNEINEPDKMVCGRNDSGSW